MGMTVRGRLVAAACALCALSLSAPALGQSWQPPPPPATPPTKAQIEEAKERYSKGIKAYEEDGDIGGALAELQRSYELAPSYKVLYNIGQVARSQPDYVTALRAYERYLADGGKDIAKARRAEVEKNVADLRNRVAFLDITANQDGATIMIDDHPIGKSPLAEAVMVNPGTRKVTITKDGLIATKVVTVVGKDKVKVQLELASLPTAQTTTTVVQPPLTATSSAPPSATQTPQTPPPGGPSYTWIGWVATGALAVGAGITGGLALAASDQLGKQSYARTPDDAANDTLPGDVKSLQDNVRTMAIVADVLAGSAVVAFGVTLIFAVKGSSRPATNTGTVALELRPAPAGMVVRGSF